MLKTTYFAGHYLKHSGGIKAVTLKKEAILLHQPIEMRRTAMWERKPAVFLKVLVVKEYILGHRGKKF